MKKTSLWMIILCMMLSCISLKAEDAPILTLGSAISSAKTYSAKLSQIRRQQELNGAKLTEAANGDSYKSYQKQYIEDQYSEKQEEVQKQVIEYEISKLFDEILLNESKLGNMEATLKNSKQSLDNAKIKLEKGLISKSSYDNTLMTYKTSENSIIQLKNTIDAQYTTLCQKMGRSPSHYTLQKEPIVYKEFTIIGSVEGTLKAKAEQNLTVWKAIEAAKINSKIDYTALEKAGYSYTTYLELQESVAQSQDTSDSTKEQYENTLRSKYTQLIQYQDKYKLQLQEIERLEKQLQTKAAQYNQGRLSKLEYDKANISVEEAKTALLEIVVNQEYIRRVIENPYLL